MYAHCNDCGKPIPQTAGRGRPPQRCERCAWVELGYKKRESRLWGYGYDQADVAHIARREYDEPGVAGGGPEV